LGEKKGNERQKAWGNDEEGSSANRGKSSAEGRTMGVITLGESYLKEKKKKKGRPKGR